MSRTTALGRKVATLKLSGRGVDAVGLGAVDRVLGALALRSHEPISRSTRCTRRPASGRRLPPSPRHTNQHARTQRSRKLAHHGGLVVLAEGVRGVAREELEHSCANTRRCDVRTRTGRIARVTATHCPRRLTPRVPAGRAPRRDHILNMRRPHSPLPRYANRHAVRTPQ